MDIRPRKTAATVRYLPCLRGKIRVERKYFSGPNGFTAIYLWLQAAIMFFALNICCVNSGTERALERRVINTTSIYR